MSVPGMNDKAVTRGTELRLDTAFLGVTQNFPPSIQQIVVNGKSFDQKALLAEIDSVRGPWKGARSAHAVLRQFTQLKPENKKAADEFLAGLEAALVACFGRESEELTKFGFMPFKRRRPLTVEEKVQRAAKAKITRQKRGTLGKKQKEAIKAEETPGVHVAPDGTVTIDATAKTN
jgi:hypothetical protein